MLVLSQGKGAVLTEITQPAASRAGASSQESHAWKGRREDEEKNQLGSLPGAKDAAFPGACLTGARWMPSPVRRQLFARIFWIWSSRFSWEVWVGQAPHPTSEPVPALPELASAPREESLGLPKLGLCRLEVTAPCSVSGMGRI